MELKTESRGKTLNILRKKWALLVVVCVLIMTLSHLLLRVSWRADAAQRWLLLAVPGMGYALWLVWQDLPLNYRKEERTLLVDFGPGTVLTITRGVLVALMAGFLLVPKPVGLLLWAPGILYWVSNLTDFFDGFLARKTDRVTQLGESLDIKLDGFGVLVATILIVQYGQVPFWYLLVGLARYLFVAGVWVRERFGKPSAELPPSIRRRAFAGVQMGFVGVILLPVFSPPGTFWAARVFGGLFLLGFLVDWLIVSRVLAPETLHRVSHVYQTTRGVIPLMVRLAAAALLAAQVIDRTTTPAYAFEILAGIEISLFLLLLFGVAGRIAAVVTLVLLGFYQISAPLSGLQIGLVVSTALVFFMGTGAYSLWGPEESLIDWHPGARS